MEGRGRFAGTPLPLRTPRSGARGTRGPAVPRTSPCPAARPRGAQRCAILPPRARPRSATPPSAGARPAPRPLPAPEEGGPFLFARDIPLLRSVPPAAEQ